MKPIESNIWRYYIFSAFSFTPFFLPILVLFWQDNGLTMFDIYLLQGIFSISMVLSELPAGMIADRLGKKASMILSVAILTVSYLIYGTGKSFNVFLIAEILSALGASLISGADSALLYDTLKHLNRESEYQKIEGRARAVQMVCFAVYNLIGGFIGSYSYRATVYLSAIGPFIALIFSFGLIEVNTNHITKSVKEAFSSYKSLMFESLKFIKKHKYIQWLILSYALFSGSASWLLWMYQPYMKWTGLPVWAFGIAFATFNLSAAYMSHKAYQLEKKYSDIQIMMMLSVLQILPLILMSFIKIPISFLFILGQQAVRGLSRPMFNHWVLKYTYADKRATVLSINSLAGRLFFAFTSPLLGYIASKDNFQLNLLCQAGFLTVSCISLIVLYKRIPEKYFKIKMVVQTNQ